MALVSNPKDGDNVSIRQAIARLGSSKLGPKSTPTFADVTTGGLTINDLDANEFVFTNASKTLVSVNVPLTVPYGGTGQTSLTDHAILLGSAVDVVTPLGVATNGQIPIGFQNSDPVLANITGGTDRISVTNGAGTIALDLATNTQTLLGSFNGIFLEKLNFTISESGGTVTGTLEQDGEGDLIQKFSDGYTTLDCTPAKTIDLTAYVGTDAVPKLVFVYILQSSKTTLVASNSDWPATEHNKIARLLLKSAVSTGTDGGALVNQNWNDYAFDATGEGHILDIEHRIRQEPAQYEDGLAVTLKNSAGAGLTTGNSSTAVEIVTAEGRVFQLHLHTFPAFDMYSVGTDFAQIANQVVDEGGAYVTTSDLVTDITRYVDGSDAGAAIGVNKYFNLVIWGVMNREGEASHIMINLPTGQYTTSANAVADIDGTSTFDIPFAFKGTGFLIARLTFRLIAGAQWTYVAIEDIRGQTPVVSAGVGITTTDHALLANLAFASTGHTGFQAQGDVLDDLNTLGAVGANSEFLVGTGAGAFAWESGATLRTSMGLGTGDSAFFTNAYLTGLLGLVDGGNIKWKDTNGTYRTNISINNNNMLIQSSGGTGGDITITANSGDLALNATGGREVALQISGTPELTISATVATFGGNIVIPDNGFIGSATDTDAIQIASDGVTTFSQSPVITGFSGLLHAIGGALSAGGLYVAAYGALFITD